MASDYFHALSLAADGDWDKAHNLIQHEHATLAWLIHGYLHWQEGDINNADYWYNKAGQSRPDSTLEQELDRLLKLAQSDT